MIIYSALLFLLLQAGEATQTSTYYNIEEAKSRCTTHFSQTPELYMNEFSWGYTLAQLSEKFDDVYQSGKRIGRHAYYDESTNTFKLFLGEYDNDAPVEITENFIKSVTFQIETAHENGFGEFVIFPDMGHAHLNFPIEHWENEYAGKGFSKAQQYAKMLADPLMRPLYHLTEQLQMLDDNDEVLEDPILSFKYWHRNFMGHNDGTKRFDIPVNTDGFNTVREVPGYHRWSSGFAVSASKDGCFAYRDKQGQKRFFDISLKDPQQDPNKSNPGYL